MSTKTTFKRIALVAVASLGLGFISVVPSQAAPTGVTISATNGSKVAGSLKNDTSTGAVVSVSALTSAVTDSVYVTITPKTVPSAYAGNVIGVMFLVDTAVSGVTTATTDTAYIGLASAGQPAATPVGKHATTVQGASNAGVYNTVGASNTAIGLFSPQGATSNASGNKGVGDSITTTSSGGGSTNAFILAHSGGVNTGYVSGLFRIYLDTSNSTAITTNATFTYTISATPYTGATAGTAVTTDVSIVVTAATAVGSGSTAYLSIAGSNTSYNTDTNTVVSTASNTTARAYLTVSLTDGTSQVPSDTVIVTTTIGNVGSSSAVGKNVQFAYTGSALDIAIFSDGTAGTASICATTNSGLTFPCRTLTFYSTSVSSITVTPLKTTLAVGSNANAFIVKALDANGNWVASASATYTFSSATGVVSDTADATTCSLDTANQRALCSLTGVTAGTASIVIGSNTAKANATTAYTVTVTANPIASIAIQTNKTSYAPGEKAYVRVVALDAAGKSVAPQTVANFFTTGGITTDLGLGSGSADMTATSVTLTNQTTTGYATGDAVAQFTVYMPAGASSITFSATGGSGLPVAAQKAVSATVSVSDSGAQALAAVTALASQVSAFITKINAQITTLTDLVMKIQKKVKA